MFVQMVTVAYPILAPSSLTEVAVSSALTEDALPTDEPVSKYGSTRVDYFLFLGIGGFTVSLVSRGSGFMSSQDSELRIPRYLPNG